MRGIAFHWFASVSLAFLVGFSCFQCGAAIARLGTAPAERILMQQALEMERVNRELLRSIDRDAERRRLMRELNTPGGAGGVRPADVDEGDLIPPANVPTK